MLASDSFSEGVAVEVRNKDGYKSVFAKERILRDAVVFYLKGTLSIRRTRYTIEIANEQHLTCPAITKTDDDLDYCWKYLNHSCEPNGYVNAADRSFRALRDIEPGEEINFNYLTTESEMSLPFTCHCGSPKCFGLIKGHHFLTPEQAERLAIMLGEHGVKFFAGTSEDVFASRKT
jgi:hypothetical protein